MTGYNPQQTCQRQLNVVFRLVGRRDVAQRQINVEKTLCISFRQRWSNVVIFNVNFHNVWQRRNKVANTTIWKKKIKPRFKNKIIFLSFKDYARLKIFFIFLILRGICKIKFAEPQKILKTSNKLNNKKYI